jgi:predicted permease
MPDGESPLGAQVLAPSPEVRATVPYEPWEGGWRAAWQVAGRVYDEFAFQSIYALKQGNILSSHEEIRKQEAVARAKKRVGQSKTMVCMLLAFVLLGGTLTLFQGEPYLASGLSPAYFATSVLAGTLLLALSLIWMTGLQITPTFLGSKVFPLLCTLPLRRKDLDRIGALVFLRMFDTPVLCALLLFPVLTALATGSWLAGLMLLPAVLVAVLFAAALSLATGRFFAERVSGARGNVRGGLLLRWVYNFLWAVPSLAITAFVSFAQPLLAILSVWQTTQPSIFHLLLLVFPFPFTFLAGAFAYPGTPLPSSLLGPLLLAMAGYLALAALALRWLLTAPVRLALTTPLVRNATGAPTASLRTGSPVGAVLQKDLRIASRTPGYAFLILLPLLDAAVIGLTTYVANPDPAAVTRYAFAAVAVAALLATFFGPAFFATEVLGFTMTRTLPLTRRTLLLGKSSLILIIYVAASLLIMGLVVARIGNPLPFVFFAAAELPAVLAASFLEMGILVTKSEKSGIPLTNLYSGAWWATLVILPGLVVAGFPLLLFEAGQYYHRVWALPSMALSALLLFGTIATWALWGKSRAL